MENNDEKYFSDEDIIVLQAEDGKEEEYYRIADVDYGDAEYAILKPVEQGDLYDDEVFIFEQVIDENQEIFFNVVEDRDLAEAVLNEYYNLLEEEDDVDGECLCDGDCDCCKDDREGHCKGCDKYKED